MRKLAQQTNANWTKTALFSSLQEFSTGVGIYWPDATRISPQGFYAGLPGCGVVWCTAIIAIFAAMTFKLYKLTDLAM